MRFFPSSFFLLGLVTDIYSGLCIDLAAYVSECFSTLAASRKVIREPRCQCVWEQKWDMAPLGSAGFAWQQRHPRRSRFSLAWSSPFMVACPSLSFAWHFWALPLCHIIIIFFLQHLFPRLIRCHPFFDVSNIFIPILEMEKLRLGNVPAELGLKSRQFSSASYV